MIALWTLLACSGDVETESPTADSSVVDSADTNSSVDTADSGTTAPPTDTEPVPLELCINEFMPNNKASLILDDGTAPDWIELHNPGDEDVHLAGWSLTDDAEEMDKEPLNSDLWVESGAFLVLYASGIEDSPGSLHLSFKLSSEGGVLGLFAPDGRGQLVTHGAVEGDFSVFRVQDCCEGDGCLDFDFRGTPGETNDPPVLVEQSLLSLGGTWRYHNLEEAPGPGWKAAAFDDSGWGSGPAPLGAGDTHQATVIDIGPEGNRWPTVYFRQVFEVTDLEAVQGLILPLIADDGALVWLNETEAIRSNLPAGEIEHGSWATAAVGDTAEYTPVDWSVDPAALVVGTNTLAVEVHQAAATSSDLTFDLGVVVQVFE